MLKNLEDVPRKLICQYLGAIRGELIHLAQIWIPDRRAVWPGPWSLGVKTVKGCKWQARQSDSKMLKEDSSVVMLLKKKEMEPFAIVFRY